MKHAKPKLEASWRQKSLEHLEKSVWTKPDFESSIVQRAYQLHKIPVGDFSADDVRFLINQQMGFPYTLELALPLLQQDLLIEAGLYPGDLLHAVLHVNKESHDRFPDYFTSIRELILPRLDELRAFRPKLSLENICSQDWL